MKELLNYTPIMLCVISESSDKETLEIVKLLLNKEGVERNCVDHDMNNIMHLAVRSRKLLVTQYLVEDIKFPVDELNSDGKSAIAIAKEYGFSEIEQFLSKFNNSESQNQILEELMSYINESEKKGSKNAKNKKKKKKDDEIVMRVSEYSQQSINNNPVAQIEIKQKEKDAVVLSEHKKPSSIAVKGVEQPVTEQVKVLKITAEEIEFYENQERLLKEKKELEIQKQEQLRQEKLKAEKDLKKQKKKPSVATQKVEATQSLLESSYPLQEVPKKDAENGESHSNNTFTTIKKEEQKEEPRSTPIEQVIHQKQIENNQSSKENEELKNRLELFEYLFREENNKRLQAERILEAKILEYNSGIINKPQSTEENINDLLSLANEELMLKSKQINEVFMT
jgi:hypothetical protein